MVFVRGNLSEEQRAKIEANRKKAIERLEQRKNNSNPSSSSSNATTVLTGPTSKSSGVSTSLPASVVPANNRAAPPAPTPQPLKRPRIELTAEQRKRIEENRQKALEIQKKKELNNRNAAKSVSEPIAPFTNVRLQKETLDNHNGNTNKTTASIRPHIKMKDYIEYDFSTMKDSHGGFIDVDDNLVGSGSSDATLQSLEDWRERQRIAQVVREAPPPMDIRNAPKCYECGSIEIDQYIYDNFREIRVCRPCAKKNPDKYSLLTKTECREDYLLTDPELKDVALLPRVEKPNPHGFSRMQLFLRYQVEKYAWKKWGSAEKLDEEWEKRESVRIQRKEKKYEEKLKEMRKRTRAEEYTRKLRNGESLGHRHVHDWSEPITGVEVGTLRRRCIDCGLETEELLL
ncbi:DNA repair protein Rad14p [[Candida] railenensis]|uniref:DNA repair protein Rad14p n=1 Tax=[Candida] railenensis TaxID=45579 RepID=A0A9P0QS93_9ASCO|nr:DNA repair protein Rad14p [[Candida] railenensis]